MIASERQEYKEWVEGNDRIWECFDSWEMLKCCGCGAVHLRRTYQQIGDDEPRTVYYPPAIARRKPAWLAGQDLLSLPMNLFPLITEVYAAAQNNLRCLAAMGIRAALETIMRGKVGSQRTFRALVDEFQKAGYLSVRQAGSLDSILEAGHAATHRDWEPTDQDIATLLDITEAVIATVYLHESGATALEAKLPKRTKPL